MTNPINQDLEKHLLAGCQIICKDSINYKTSEGNYTHILLKCPKEYEFDKERKAYTGFMYVKVYRDSDKWFEAVRYFSNQSHAKKSFYDHLTEDRHYEYLIKKNKEKETERNNP